MKIRGMAIALLALSVGACSTGTDSVPRENYGIVFAETRAVNEGYALSPTASFFSSPQLTFNTSVQSADACVVTEYDPDLQDNLPGLRFLNAGEQLTATLSGETRTLVRTTENEAEIYKITTGGGIVFEPGDTLRVSAPGSEGGFPAFDIEARTAEFFTFTEPAPPASGEPLVLTWSPRPVVGSTMLVSLRYVSAGGTELDRQIYCDLVDDGSFTIPASQIVGWSASTEREHQFTRWRTQVEQLNDNSFVVVSSTLSIPTEGATPTFARSLGRISRW